MGGSFEIFCWITNNGELRVDDADDTMDIGRQENTTRIRVAGSGCQWTISAGNMRFGAANTGFFSSGENKFNVGGGTLLFSSYGSFVSTMAALNVAGGVFDVDANALFVAMDFSGGTIKVASEKTLQCE
ncbi:hypothetical protein RAS1_43660 [Phycisphaerae bacterium RAS1]|nr:hypothetical protein RAS1_43660 [Phycisphaerae bacterium RAS1]